MGDEYRRWMEEAAPPWLAGDVGAPVLRALRDQLDLLVERIREGVRQRFPELAAYDALTLTGYERQIDRSAVDTDATYAQRVREAWTTWPFGGTCYAMLRA